MSKLKTSFLLLFLVASNSVYADVVTYAGSSCLPGYGATYTANGLGHMMNFGSSNSISLICNIPNNHNTSVVNSVAVHYIENNPTFDMICTLNNGQVLRSTGASQAQQSFVFNSTTVNNGVPLMLSCTLPPNTSGAAPALVKFTVDTP